MKTFGREGADRKVQGGGDTSDLSQDFKEVHGYVRTHVKILFTRVSMSALRHVLLRE